MVRARQIFDVMPRLQFDDTAVRRGRLLVLDLDHTLVDISSPRFDITDSTTYLRPNVRRFLRIVSVGYDIAFWSLSSAESVQRKLAMLPLTELGIRPVFALDRSYAICYAFTPDKTSPEAKNPPFDVRRCLAKPLGYLSVHLPYRQRDIIHIDDNGLCTQLSGDNVVLIRPWRFCQHQSGGLHFGYRVSSGVGDADLLHLADYLNGIKNSADLRANHSVWMKKYSIRHSPVQLFWPEV